jgi:hypothetical protein
MPKILYYRKLGSLLHICRGFIDLRVLAEPQPTAGAVQRHHPWRVTKWVRCHQTTVYLI